MAEQFYSILTKIGKAKVANSSALGTKVSFTTFVLGDGNGAYYNPTEDQTSLKNEVWRGPVNNLKIHKDNNNWIVAVVSIPADIGNFMIREAGILDDEGNLLVIGKYPETYKPIASNGSTKDLTIRLILEVSNTAAVTLKVDPSTTIATKEDVEELQEQIENIKVPLTSVNGKTGDAVLNAEDIGAAKQSDLIRVQEKISNLSLNDMEARKEIIDMKLKLKEQTAISFLNKTGIGFYDTFENNNNIDTTTTATYDSTNKNVDFPFVSYNVKATGDYNNVALINIDKQPTIEDKIDNINKILGITAKDNSVTFDRTVPVSVVNSAYQTSATARPQVLSNGWIVNCLYDPASHKLLIKCSKNNGSSFYDMCYVPNFDNGSFAMMSYETKVYIVWQSSQYPGQIHCSRFDATTVTNINIQEYSELDKQNSFGTGCSIAVNSKGELTAAWCSKNSTYPNSFNIRSVKSIDGGATWTKQDGTAGVDQLNSNNGPGYDCVYPYVQYDKNDEPVIIIQFNASTTYYISNFTWTGNSWTSHTIYDGHSYSQSYPVATLQKYGTNAGRIWVVWYGLDSIDTIYENIRISYSDDDGLTWNTPQKLTNGNERQDFPTITSDISGKVYIMWEGGITNKDYFNIREIIWNGISWSGITDITSQNVQNMRHPTTCDNYYNFTNPITVWQDLANNRVAFYGKWTAQIKTYDITLENLITVTKDQVLNVYAPLKQLKLKDEKFDTFNNLELNCYANEINKITIKGNVNNNTSIVTGVTDRELVAGDKLFTNNVLNEVVSAKSNIVSYDVKDATVINQAYDTNGNGGRKLVRLSNGWLVAGVWNTSYYIKLYVSKDNGNTWVLYNTSSWGFNRGFALISHNTDVYVLASTYGTLNSSRYDVYSYGVDLTGINITTGCCEIPGATQTDGGQCSLAINEAGTELHACWSSKNQTYPNNFNIRYCKGNITSDGSITWGSVEQVTNADNGTINMMNPTIICDADNHPVILYEDNQSTTKYIDFATYNGTSWMINKTVYNGGSYLQSSPCAIFVPREINGLPNGRIWVTWHGKDSTDTGVDNIKVSYSDDNGATWSSAYKITAGNIYSFILPSITANKNNDIFIVFQNNNSSYGISKVRCSGTTWYSRITIKEGVNYWSSSTLLDLSLNFTEPLFIYQDNQNSKVGFYGTWTAKEGYKLEMKDSCTLSDGQQVPIVDVNSKQGDTDLTFKAIDKTKIVFSGSNLNTDAAKISIQGKDTKLNSIVYAIS